MIDTENDAVRVKVVERETSAAEHIVVPAALLASPVYAGLRKSYARLQETMGTPPFTISLGKKQAAADTYEDAALPRDRHREGGDPGQPLQGSRRDGRRGARGRRRWTRPSGCSSASTSRMRPPPTSIFSTLMGDQVEPRRLFIEQNAKDVKFLDV